MSLDEENLERAKKAVKAIEAEMKSTLHIQEKLNQGLGEYAKALQDIGRIEAMLKKAEADRLKLKKQHEEAELKYKEKLAAQEAQRIQIAADLNSIDANTVRNAKEKLEILNDDIKAEKKLYDFTSVSLKNHEKIVEAQKEQLEVLKKAVKESNQYLATWNSIKKVPGLLKNGFTGMMNPLKPLFEMDKEIRNAARSMNILGKGNFKSFSNGLLKAAESTVTMGVNVKDLAKMQQGYSEGIGKSVELTEDGNIAMARMAEGTGLGSEFAVQMASEMDKFGASASAARDLVSDTIKKASKMGVNGAAAGKKLVSLLKLSQTYVFKGGVKALSSMANDAERLRLDLEGAAGMAEKVMRPEGAVETAALLTTMGGEFGKLGDPFQLMFKARNDFAGFTKDIGKATSEFIDFNKETGAFEIKGGLARDRMKEISTITGISMEKLQEMGEAQRKIQMIGEKTGGMFSEEDTALLGTLAQIGKDGQIKIKFRGQEVKNLSQVNKGMLDAYKSQSANLEEMAEQSRTFDEVVDDLIMSFKQQLLPFVQGLKDTIGTDLQGIVKTLTDKGFYTRLRETAEKFGYYAGRLWDFAKIVLAPIAKFTLGLANFIADNPITSLVTILGGWVALKAATWFANGMALAAGFKSATGGFGAGFRQVGQTFSRGKKGGKLGLGIGAGLGVAGAIGGMATSAFTDPGSGANWAGNIASGALSGAGMGSMFGVPGMILGGLVGGGIGAYNAWMNGKEVKKPSYNDAVIYGDDSDQIANSIQWHPNDKFVEAGNSLIAGTDKGAVERAANTMMGGNSGNSTGNGVNHYGTVKHEMSGQILVKIDGSKKSTKIVINDIINNPSLTNLVTQAVNQANNANRGGGVPRGKNLDFNYSQQT